ncbi:hypothetical protein IJI69_04535 [Candidatus Saccharibacteria bacterium]|nr:hypothetical protein [Candidatus Saccharibacteria bacterium]
MEENKEKKNKNLLVLGIIAVGIALTTTVVSLVVYHNSGDIYLDRSRPGFLPSEDEVKDLPEKDYTFPSSGELTEETLDEYIKNFQEVIDYIDDLESPFSEAPLTDYSLGIPSIE